jgi:hypothetical protein
MRILTFGKNHYEKLHIHNDFYQMLKSAFPFINKNDLVVWFEKSYDVDVTFFAV